ncbi:MAG TPA: hypothetical protein PKW90_18300, partial [Myxococcota bacterium]|nr:hypothetical protein [Myxococcota bacterium]
SVGIPIVVVATDQTPDAQISAFLNSISAELAGLRRAVPVLGRLSVGGIAPGRALPVHPAAARFFSRRAG